MSTRFQEIMHQKSEEGLMDYLNNFQRYVPDAISAAVEELKSRGKNFTEAELEAIRAKIDKRIKAYTLSLHDALPIYRKSVV